ncbi:hypothetical protein [Streptomyces canus]|uniref:hypothetical protein n=1 Tax=Streptomyces canus TaxID=58343 RepID=UPI00035FE5A4|nr:hypothetical protein [Streptomyces canus]
MAGAVTAPHLRHDPVDCVGGRDHPGAVGPLSETAVICVRRDDDKVAYVNVR